MKNKNQASGFMVQTFAKHFYLMHFNQLKKLKDLQRRKQVIWKELRE